MGDKQTYFSEKEVSGVQHYSQASIPDRTADNLMPQDHPEKLSPRNTNFFKSTDVPTKLNQGSSSKKQSPKQSPR
jgi:hypothetical protein